MNYPTPLFDYCIILPDPIEVNPLLPDDMNKAPKSGVVKAIGVGRQCEESGIFITMQVQVEDRVLFERTKGAMINIENIEHLVLRQTDFILIL